MSLFSQIHWMFRHVLPINLSDPLTSLMLAVLGHCDHNNKCDLCFTSHHPSPDWIHSLTVACTGPPCAPFLSEAFSATECFPLSSVAPLLCTGHASLCLQDRAHKQNL